MSQPLRALWLVTLVLGAVLLLSALHFHPAQPVLDDVRAAVSSCSDCVLYYAHHLGPTGTSSMTASRCEPQPPSATLRSIGCNLKPSLARSIQSYTLGAVVARSARRRQCAPAPQGPALVSLPLHSVGVVSQPPHLQVLAAGVFRGGVCRGRSFCPVAQAQSSKMGVMATIGSPCYSARDFK